MESILGTLVFHQITVASLKGCVAVSPSEDGLDVAVELSKDTPIGHSCNLPQESVSPDLPAPFERAPLAERISIMVERLMETDGQAWNDFVSGTPVKKRISAGHPLPLTIDPDTPNLADYRETRQSSAELIRPILLSSPEETRLRPFQVTGVHWLLQNKKAILADDMGLGKTVQAIFALRILFNQGSVGCALIVCSKLLLTNWEEELSRWAPELSRIRVTPPSTIRDQAWKVILGKVHVILANYEQLRSPLPVLERDGKDGFDVIVVDEAHRIRNAGSLVAKGIRRIRTDYLWALTGTPIERDPADLATLLATLEPDRFSVTDNKLHPTSLRSQARPYILRRLKSDVLAEIPEVLESKQSLELLPGQRESYRLVYRRLTSSEKTLFLATINELRTICDYDERTDQSSKVERIMEILQDVCAAEEKAVVFSYLLKPLDVLYERLRRTFGTGGIVELRGSMTAPERDEAIHRFKTDPRVHAILCSSRVASEGLNLTEANHVIFFNEWWNPSANAQARDRVVRMGQRLGVHVYKFKCKGTIEEVLEDILESKSRTVAQLIDKLAEPGIPPEQLEPIVSALSTALAAKP